MKTLTLLVASLLLFGVTGCSSDQKCSRMRWNEGGSPVSRRAILAMEKSEISQSAEAAMIKCFGSNSPYKDAGPLVVDVVRQSVDGKKFALYAFRYVTDIEVLFIVSQDGSIEVYQL